MSDVTPAQADSAVAKSPRFNPMLLPLGVQLAMVWMLICLGLILVLPLIVSLDVNAISLTARLQPPVFFGGTLDHALGTDDLGRDVLARLIASLQTSLSIALAATVISATLGTLIGVVSAHFGGWIDQFIVAAVDAQVSVPFIIISLTLTAIFGNNFLLFIFILGLFGWERYTRLARAMTLASKGRGYVLAMRTLGFPWRRIYLRHVLPNIASSLLVTATITFPEVILLETSLSFLGLGIQPPMTSLGNMLGFGRSYLLTGWWIAVAPALVIFLCALAVSIIGDWARSVISRI
ncbi:ABC transporter permease [Pelagibacterium sp.]|uniref:ABC transporter permease n=1 Tax=Pelagibacterium sp. TaxID=1967288 RepID=UPI003BA966DB